MTRTFSLSLLLSFLPRSFKMPRLSPNELRPPQNLFTFTKKKKSACSSWFVLSTCSKNTRTQNLCSVSSKSSKSIQRRGHGPSLCSVMMITITGDSIYKLGMFMQIVLYQCNLIQYRCPIFLYTYLVPRPIMHIHPVSINRTNQRPQRLAKCNAVCPRPKPILLYMSTFSSRAHAPAYVPFIPTKPTKTAI
jgi:hypothetical protein